jgi:hypothetical protein
MDPNDNQVNSGTGTATATEKTVTTEKKPWIAQNENGHVLHGTAYETPPAGYKVLTTPVEIKGALDSFSNFELKEALTKIYAG